MSHLIASAPTRARARAFQDRSETDHTDHDNDRARSRLWTLIEALAYAGAYIDPSGILAVERLRQAKAEEERNG
ncbi:MAG TPA: hypothetical protein VL330_05855 [Actinomycetes bacterium]|nr:hypothetical protein [Actinomycetes bacterium]